MAARISSFLNYYILTLCLLYSLEKGFALQGKEAQKSHGRQRTYTVQLSSLQPSSICSPSSTVPKGKGGASIKVIHKYGPCSHPHQAGADHTKNILKQDKARVDWINSRLSKKSFAAANDTRYDQQDATNLPVNSGEALGTGNYIVTVGLGTPKEDLSLVLDTGSDLTWTQCQPCAGSCYSQKDPIFDPSKSSSYSAVACTSTECSQLLPNQACANQTSKCKYGVGYGDGSYTVGYFSKETLKLQSDVINNFFFGCGQNNSGLFGNSTGLIGLGRGNVSIVEQAAQKYNRIFSYCLPSTSSSTGYLTFGSSGSGGSVRYTPLSTLSQGTSFCALSLVGISVNGSQLELPATAFQSGTIIDSGTVITRLPPTVYSALRSEFRKGMAKYRLVSTDTGLFDTCYDLSQSENGTVQVPKIAFSFDGGAMVDLAPSGILYDLFDPPGTYCLAFAGNKNDSDLTIFGNVQQKTFLVVYDVGGVKVGFGPGGCS